LLGFVNWLAQFFSRTYEMYPYIYLQYIQGGSKRCIHFCQSSILYWKEYFVIFSQTGLKDMKAVCGVSFYYVLLQPLRWRCIECAIHHEREVRKEQHPYISGANKQ